MGGEGDQGAGPSRKLACLRVAGAWSGVVEVPLEEWTIKDLRAEVGRLSGFAVESINLISAGRNLKDVQSGVLKAIGLGENSKLLVTRIGGEQAIAMNKERERSERLARIKAAADAMAKRSNEDGFATDDYDMQLENQSGERALKMGLMLHAKGQELIKQSQFTEALEVLSMSEESFSLCDRKILEAVDNVALLHLDTVWCFFMLRDLALLAVARERLSMSREGLSRSHGRNLERLRVLQGGFCPELAVYVRLELLEGVVAYHSGRSEAARQSLTSAQQKFQQLQVSDEAVAQLANMGFTTKESRRALRMSGQDVQRAVEFLMEERRKKSEKLEEDRRQRRERKEQKKYGKTMSGKAVDMTMLNELASIGYDRQVVAEALRQSENSVQLALDMLSNPATFAALQISLLEPSSTKPSSTPVDEAVLEMLLSMGFEREQVIRALKVTANSNEAIERLIQGQFADAEGTSTSGGESTEVASSSVASGEASRAETPDFGGLDTPPVDMDPRDQEMETEIAANLSGDPLAEYDLEVDKEGEAIFEYLGLVDSLLTVSA
ncbi:hypothetical protein AXG93_939s1110 [Marchantia polymorpha subsp. ruderalis]|uniref:UBA domain-containing protein n=1 Tax=Marchantia polymorpha subsp. ruderalis TaxID=1480154 RepID=A0A176VKZ8_MARPO|nr:hypothetical protein AXG93_939s1110 [Marchantia polymorpha subsp. ruderalis]